MSGPTDLVEVWRGPILESLHTGHAVVCRPGGGIVEAWGDPQTVILPRSSCKMLQALPLAENLPALSRRRLALACSSHTAAAPHMAEVAAWLGDLGLADGDLRCGPEAPRDTAMAHEMIRQRAAPTRAHNTCSGKHSGFLALSRHLGGGPEYIDPHHPVQRAVKDAFEDCTVEASPGFGIDGCSAPNHATTLHGLARAMARFAEAGRGGGVRSRAMERLVESMMTYPQLVAGEGRACTGLMRAAGGHAVVKTGAEGVFVAILPGKRLGMAVKIADGATRAAECVITALLVRHGILDANDPAAAQWMRPTLRNCAGLDVGQIRPAAGLDLAKSP